ncbi:hypothetical protein DX908_13395 [Parvularcula marina]|uniref:Peroxidase n=2 Tax=Parvularcula marina TaxID=2292771 RepID=A0A371RL55_9PROT|nr:hypothetical protein DX908_13395 [Parvularcula marina]
MVRGMSKLSLLGSAAVLLMMSGATAESGLQETDEQISMQPNMKERSPSSQNIERQADPKLSQQTHTLEIDSGVSLIVGGREVRTLDGSGNNVDHPEWGSAFSHLVRMGFPDYSDGVSAMAGALRASAREVSNAVSNQPPGVTIPNPMNATDFVWQWGQFLDHDIGLTDGLHEQADILVPFGDPWFDPNNTGMATIPFNRALYDDDTGTHTENPREQENEITAWIDGSMVYGSSRERLDVLKVGPNSAHFELSYGQLLPFNVQNIANANGFVSDPTTLFVAGDVRANEQVGLAAMHTLFAREHNRLVLRHKRLNPEHGPREVFEGARRLTIGQIQHITYTEFLPALIGPDALPPYEGYKPDVHPGLYNEFSSAAYRMGHSMINTHILRLNKSGGEIKEGHLSLREAFFTAPSVINRKKAIDPIFRGLASQPHQRIDTMIVDDLRNFLFGQPGQGGLDLASINIQRGRDHGLPCYNDMREIMGLPRATSFADVTSNLALQTALASVYPTVDDIDLWVGGLAEDPMIEVGSQVGPLLREIIIKQFTALRDGDRFWYESYLEPEELQFVRRRTLAKVIRTNTGVGHELQDDVFHMPE